MQTTEPKVPFQIGFAAVPLFLGVALLQIYDPVGEPLNDAQLTSLREMKPSFVRGSITYVSATVVHLSVCVCAFLYFERHIAGATPVAMYWRYLFTAAAFAFLVLLFLFYPFLSPDCALRFHELMFFDFEKIYSKFSKCCGQHSWARLIVSEQSSFFPTFRIAAMLPTLIGVFVASVGAAAADASAMPAARRWANLQERLIGVAGEDRKDGFGASQRRSLMYCSLVLGAVLTTSTVSSAIFLHLPQRVFDSHQQRELCGWQDCALEELQNYADELTLFLGTIYTLTVLAAIAGPFWRLQRAKYRLGYGGQTRALVANKAAELPIREYFSVALQVIAVLTPLISGLLSNWVQ